MWIFFFSFHLKVKKCYSKIFVQLLNASRLFCKTIILCIDIYMYALTTAMSKALRFYSFQVCKDVSYTKPVSVTHMPLLSFSLLFITWWCLAVCILCLFLLNQLMFVGVWLGIGCSYENGSLVYTC